MAVIWAFAYRLAVLWNCEQLITSKRFIAAMVATQALYEAPTLGMYTLSILDRQAVEEAILRVGIVVLDRVVIVDAPDPSPLGGPLLPHPPVGVPVSSSFPSSLPWGSVPHPSHCLPPLLCPAATVSISVPLLHRPTDVSITLSIISPPP